MPKPAARVLVADPDPALRPELTASFTWDGHDVAEVASAAELARALECAWSIGRAFRVLVVEAALPDASPFAILAHARAAGIRPRTVVLASSPDARAFYEAYRQRCLCVLQKPVDRTELRRVVRLAAEAEPRLRD